MSDKNLTVTKSAAILLLTGLGLHNASGYNAARCAAKIKTLPGTIDEAKSKPEDKESKSLLKKILATLEAGGEVAVEDDDAEEAPAAKKGKKEAAKPAKGKKSKAKEEEPEDEDEEADDESEDDEEASDEEESEDEETEEEEESDEEEEEDDEDEKPAKKSKAKGKKAAKGDKTKKDGTNFKRAGGPDGVGVIGSILEFMTEASKDKPIDKKGLLAKLVKRFPDRDESSMKATINAQVPNRIAKEKKVTVKTNDEGGYWVAKGGSGEKSGKKAKA